MKTKILVVLMVLWLAGGLAITWLSFLPPADPQGGAPLASGPDMLGLLTALACGGFAYWYHRFLRTFRVPAHEGYAWRHIGAWLVGGALIAAPADRFWAYAESMGGYQAAEDAVRTQLPVGGALLAVGLFYWIRGGLFGARSLRG